jgi:hypothetical protein
MDTPRDITQSGGAHSEKLFLNYKKAATIISYDDMINNPSTYVHPFEETPRYMVPQDFQ